MERLKQLGVILCMLGLLIVGCSPQGISPKFYEQATSLFSTIDSNTEQLLISKVEVYEELDRLKETADTPKEKEAVRLLKQLIALQRQVIQREETAIQKYLELRKKIADLLVIALPPFRLVSP